MKIKLIKVRRFGRIDIKPACENSLLFLALVSSSRKRNSFQTEDIEIIQMLGVEIEYINEE